MNKKKKGMVEATIHLAGNRRYAGKRTGHDYGRVGHGQAIWAYPADIAADPNLHRVQYGIAMPPELITSVFVPPELESGVETVEKVVEPPEVKPEPKVDEPPEVKPEPKVDEPPKGTTVKDAAELGKLFACEAPRMPVYAPGETYKAKHNPGKTIEQLQNVSGFEGPYLSVVTGTYNRLEHLKTMINSVRQDAVMYGIPTEIVIVDGGSTDGTLEWLNTQPDIVTIAQGELLGAIKAFNAGGFAAKGKYIVFANDDVFFQSGALMRAIVYMDNNPAVGQGAFYQDRPRNENQPSEMHVQRMRARHPGDPDITAAHYAQVSIQPKWLGDLVGWWGDFGSRTYGGDNYLSACILETGLRVSPIPGACIHDQRVKDELRAINSGGRTEHGHPDSVAYKNAFPDGPLIGSKPLDQTQIPKETTLARILYVPIIPRGGEQKRGLLDALRRRALVCQLDYRGYINDGTRQRMMEQLSNAAAVIQPDLFFFQIHDGNVFTAADIQALREKHPGAIFLNFNGDKIMGEPVLPREMTPLKVDLFNSFHLMTGVDYAVLCGPEVAYPYQIANGRFWAHGFAPDFITLEPDEDTPQHDVVYFGNGYCQVRRDMELAVREIDGLDIGFYGNSWVEVAGNTHYDYARTGQIQRNAKVVISDALWPDTKFYHSNRCINSLAGGGALVLQQWFDGMEELGFLDGVTCIVWRDIPDLVKQVKFWAKAKTRNVTKRRAIANAGRDYARKNHNYDVRMEELVFNLLPQVEGR